MKKHLTATVAALFAMTALASPAKANDNAIRLGIGIGGLIIGEIIKGAKGAKAQPKKSRQKQRQQQSRAKSTTRNAAPTVASFSPTPEVGPLPEWRPDPSQMAALEPSNNEGRDLETPIADYVAVVKAEPRELVDEQGRLWGAVPSERADTILKAIDLGMMPSEAFAALSGLDEPTPEAPPVVEIETAAAPIVETDPVVDEGAIVEVETMAEATQEPEIDEGVTAAIRSDIPTEVIVDEPSPKLNLDL